jgi:5-oxoprolinase (ATP-hydrolysing) subunit A
VTAGGPTLDLNADMGESFGPWSMGADEALLGFVTTVHVACGFHAGDPEVMASTLRQAGAAGVVVGAHPSYPDLAGFGRRAMSVSPERIKLDLLYQLGALDGIGRSVGVRVRSVKPHGALYNRMAVEPAVARGVAEAVASYSAELWVVMPAGSAALRAAQDVGVRVATEAFCDRAYLPDGRLVPRSEPAAMITDPARAAARAVAFAAGSPIDAIDGSPLVLDATTVCIHGDSPGAAAIAAHVRLALEAAGVTVASYAGWG